MIQVIRCDLRLVPRHNQRCHSPATNEALPGIATGSIISICTASSFIVKLITIRPDVQQSLQQQYPVEASPQQPALICHVGVLVKFLSVPLSLSHVGVGTPAGCSISASALLNLHCIS